MSLQGTKQEAPASNSGGGESSYTKFVYLRTALSEIESDITVANEKATVKRPLNATERSRLAQNREAVVSGFENSRFIRGKLLSEYRQGYRESKGPWMKALKAIANCDGVHYNTISNYIKDYESAKYLPESIRLALQEQGVDAAKKKNRALIERIMNRLKFPSEPKEPSRDEATQIVAEEMMKTPVAPDFAGISEPLNAEEQRRHLIRKGIRQSVKNIPTRDRLEAVKAALEEEMYMNWGVTEPKTIILTPHSTPITCDGRKLKTNGDTQEVAA